MFYPVLHALNLVLQVFYLVLHVLNLVLQMFYLVLHVLNAVLHGFYGMLHEIRGDFEFVCKQLYSAFLPQVLFKRIPVANWIEISNHPFSIWGYPIEAQKALLSFASGSL